MKINELQPKAVWGYFADICAIPHPSKHEAALLEYLKDFAKKHNLGCKQDATGNLVIEKPASKGYESHDGVILQAHIDMVPQKNSDVNFDFTKDPIVPLIEGEWVTAQDTTLGADNGIGCAAMLAILADNSLKHPHIEALFTVDEETGLTGANGLDPKLLSGKILINLDSEDEGELYVGCAGAVNNSVEMSYSSEAMPSGYTTLELSIKGLKGGHSGMEIILQRGNANKLLVRFLRENQQKFSLRIVEIDGGGLRNAIPREARAIVAVPSESVAELRAVVQAFEQTLQFEYAAVEDAIRFSCADSPSASEVLRLTEQITIINALTATPNGIYRMSDAMEGLVETSTNMSRVELRGGKLQILFMTRCMVNYGKKELNSMIRSVWELAGATVSEQGDYDGWAPNMNSTILARMKELYAELYGETPEIKAIHAGLECGIIGAKYPELDMISIGPTIRFPHSPDEKVNIETVSKFYDFLNRSLATL